MWNLHYVHEKQTSIDVQESIEDKTTHAKIYSLFLLRWHHSSNNLIFKLKFISTTEQMCTETSEDRSSTV